MKNALSTLVSASTRHVQSQIDVMLKADPNNINKPWE